MTSEICFPASRLLVQPNICISQKFALIISVYIYIIKYLGIVFDRFVNESCQFRAPLLKAVYQTNPSLVPWTEQYVPWTEQKICIFHIHLICTSSSGAIQHLPHTWSSWGTGTTRVPTLVLQTNTVIWAEPFLSTWI